MANYTCPSLSEVTLDSKTFPQKIKKNLCWCYEHLIQGRLTITTSQSIKRKRIDYTYNQLLWTGCFGRCRFFRAIWTILDLRRFPSKLPRLPWLLWKMELNTIYEGFFYVNFFQSATFKGNEPAIETELKQPQTITQTSGVST